MTSVGRNECAQALVGNTSGGRSFRLTKPMQLYLATDAYLNNQANCRLSDTLTF
jgi:hypothetical protein